MKDIGPFAGIRILDLATALAGPWAAGILADQGADVIKIEVPGFGDILRYMGPSKNGITAIFQNVNRGKRSLALNLKSPKGLDIFKKLVETADVVIHNFRPGVAERLGIDYSSLKKIKDNLIYLSVTGFGDEGPYAHKAAWDNVIQAFSGVAQSQANAETGEPIQYNQIFADKLSALTGSQAISAALYARERGKGGQHIKLAMVDSIVSFLWGDVGAEAAFVDKTGVTQAAPLAKGVKLMRFKDGWAQVAPVSDAEFFGLCRAFDVSVEGDARLANVVARMQNMAAMQELFVKINAIALEIPVDLGIARLEEQDVPCARAMCLDDLPSHPQMQANGTFGITHHPTAGDMVEPRNPPKFSQTPTQIGAPAPGLGQHTEEILLEIGLANSLNSLRAEQAIG